MMKEWNLRLTETITFIRTAAVPANGGIRNLIADVLEFKYRSGIPQATSVAMSQGNFYALRGRDAIRTTRKYRRAIILIRSAILGVYALTAATAAALIPDVNLPGSLGGYLLAAQQHETGLLQTALNNLQHQAAVFLTANKINMEASAASGRMNYVFYYDLLRRRYDFARTAHLTAGEMLLTSPTGTRFRVPHISPMVHHVHVQPFMTVYGGAVGNLANINGAALDNNDNLMITTQLSGCSVVYQTQGTDLRAAHINPGGPHPGLGRHYLLVQTMRAHAGFANPIAGGPAVQVFGAAAADAQRDYFPDRYTYCIGVKTGGAWELHAQKHRNTPADVPVTWRIEP